ncbi:hypothetical protein CCHR01_13109 [Colletotrichum chrysophilum]|uniref:DUF3295 domain-containing protein n=1 Tax=Colletotrichum chrysophilum TaxID=1836956 RepID=A0AAD9AA12_9PEZI|nr:hypothetical protein CCHR01_13109 [Colletotrichum chrysophilum]
MLVRGLELAVGEPRPATGNWLSRSEMSDEAVHHLSLSKILDIDDIMGDNRNDDEGYCSDNRDATTQEFSERRDDDDDNALNMEMLKRRLQHFELSDPDITHLTVIIGDRFSRLMAGYFEKCQDDSGEFEFTEYILLQPGATVDIQVAVPDLNRAPSSASRTRKTLSRMEQDEIRRVERMMQEIGIENTRHIDAFYPDEPGLAREIAQGKIHGWNGLAGEETQSSSDTLAHFLAWNGVGKALLLSPCDDPMESTEDQFRGHGDKTTTAFAGATGQHRRTGVGILSLAQIGALMYAWHSGRPQLGRVTLAEGLELFCRATTLPRASHSPTAMGVLMPVTEPIADMPSPLLPGAGSPLGTRRLAAECGHPLLEYLGGSDTSKILSYSWARNILLRTSRVRRSAGFRKFTTIPFHTLQANHTTRERPQHRKEPWTATPASIDTSMAWTAPAGSTSMARVAKIASSTTARVEIRGLKLIDEKKEGERAHVSAALCSPELTLFIPNVQYCECDLADERQRDWPASPQPKVMTAAAAVSAYDCYLPTVVPRSLMLNGESSWTPCESKRHKSTPCPGVVSDPLDTAFCGQSEQSRVLRSTTTTADTTWKQGSSEKRANAKAKGTTCDDPNLQTQHKATPSTCDPHDSPVCPSAESSPSIARWLSANWSSASGRGNEDSPAQLVSTTHHSVRRPHTPAQATYHSLSYSKRSPFAMPRPSGTHPDDSDTGYVDESVIDDEDDSSEWEDSIEDSNKSSIDEKTFFQRVDSQVNLTSRRSLLTFMINQQTRNSHPAPPTLAVSPNDSDDAPLMMKRGNRSSSLKPTTEVPRSAAQLIPATVSHSQLEAALSPRTNRRNMLATELTESLRRNLLWEHQQRFSTANAVLKRCPTSYEVANLKQHPEKVYLNKNEDFIEAHQYSYEYNPNGYHSKGW